MKVTIDRDKWLRGLNTVCSLAYEGKYCVLSFIAVELGRTFPQVEDDTKETYDLLMGKGIRPDEYFIINDNRGLSDEVIEKRLTKRALEDNIELEFIG